MRIMDRFPVVVYIGAGLIAWTAGEMIDSDAAVRPYLPGIFHETYWLPLAITVVVIGYGWWHNRRAGRRRGPCLRPTSTRRSASRTRLTDPGQRDFVRRL